jgi:hypothetical protein
MWKFIKQEWKFWLRSPMTWIFLGVNTLLILGAVSSENIMVGGETGSVNKNAPYVIQNYYGIMSLICLLMTSAYMGATANRDFQYNMHPFIFSSPIKKSHYYFGKFIGAATVSVIPFLGISLGALLGPFMPWADPLRCGPIYWTGHINGLLCYAIPNTLIAGVILYGMAILYRSVIVSTIGAVGLLLLFGIAAGFTGDIEKEWLSVLLDPFGFRPAGIVSKYFTVDEKNTSAIPLSGWLLFNRIIWVGFSLLILFIIYFRFSFSEKNQTKRDKKQVPNANENDFSASDKKSNQIIVPVYSSWQSYLQTILFETKTILKNPTFIILCAIGIINLLVSLSFTGSYGEHIYPVTYQIVDTIRSSFYSFLIAIIVFYSGELVWKERDSGIHDIIDATPAKNSLFFISKLSALTLALCAVLLCSVIIGTITQLFNGYTQIKPDVYFKSLMLIDIPGFVYLSVAALLFHYLINNKNVAYFAFVVFLILNEFAWGALDIQSNMLIFGGIPNVTYSDMNGFGPFIKSLFWFNIYWTLASAIMCFIVFAFYVRGRELRFKFRIDSALKNMRSNRILIGVLSVLFIVCTSFVYYNTQILNTYFTGDELEKKSELYERKYKKYEKLAQPKITRVHYTIDLMPYERNLFSKAEIWLKNKTKEDIQEVHFTMPLTTDSITIAIQNATLKLRDNDLNYRIYQLKNKLKPGDSLKVLVNAAIINTGFENEVSLTSLTQNGTFFNQGDIVPGIGYNSDFEISDKNKRKKMGLPAKKRSTPLNELDSLSRMKNYVVKDADWVKVETIISTAEDQIAVAPGSLISTWKEKGKSYFHYKLDKASLNFYSFISARYEVARKNFKGINLEVYFINEHAYNVPNMLNSMEKSLDYFTTHFGPYYHKQARIIEFPRYASFAQAFPGTMPYSEGIGFIQDLRDVKGDDIDMVFYIVAHEMGHQYWAHQLTGAAMQGSEWMSEGFAQYSALMVMEKEYGKEKMNKFLKYEMNGYLTGRGSELEAERPIYKTEGQSYIHYQKASIAMYYLKEMIGETNINRALQKLINEFAYKEPPYATSMNAIRAFEEVTPDSLKYLVDDLFMKVILFSNRIESGSFKKINDEYEVTMKVISEKFLSDSLGKEISIPVNDFMDIVIFGSRKPDSDSEPVLMKKRIKINAKETKLMFRVKEQPLKICVDPYHYLIDRVPDDNVKIIDRN